MIADEAIRRNRQPEHMQMQLSHLLIDSLGIATHSCCSTHAKRNDVLTYALRVNYVFPGNYVSLVNNLVSYTDFKPVYGGTVQPVNIVCPPLRLIFYYYSHHGHTMAENNNTLPRFGKGP